MVKDLLRLAEANQARARRLLKEVGVTAAWEAIGADVSLVGSLRSGLLMTHRDIDVHLYTETLNPEESFRALARICAHPAVTGMEFRNLAETGECCFEFHLSVRDERGDLWRLDMIQIRRGSRYDGYFEQVADRIREVLTPEWRRTILMLKCAAPEAAGIMGLEYCRAVIEGGVRSWPEFIAWRAMNPVSGILAWRP